MCLTDDEPPIRRHAERFPVVSPHKLPMLTKLPYCYISGVFSPFLSHHLPSTITFEGTDRQNARYRRFVHPPFVSSFIALSHQSAPQHRCKNNSCAATILTFIFWQLSQFRSAICRRFLPSTICLPHLCKSSSSPHCRDCKLPLQPVSHLPPP